MLVVDRKLAGVLGGLGNIGVILSIAGLGAVLDPSEVGIGFTLAMVILGIGSVLALMIGLTSLAHHYNIPIKEKTTKFAWATLITYILAMLFLWLKPESSIGAFLVLAFIGLLIWTKKDVYVYTGQASSIFGIVAKVYARVSRKVIDPHSGGSGNVVVVMTPDAYVGSGIAMQIFALLLALVLWFTLEPIAWILWGLTGK
ncbi:hypothetical protein E3E35_01110 [Thermococcus sp. GR7]|uniref:hypothetical protein n=1 Tax=unclassified Thermococcus TaxID=2627626 RepID=UPI001430EFD1|nr:MULTISPECIES: hypothetical protein [unclassified Thermococcus]NJE46028.1 hypothetical protein [Thermococcus sp. GR7]NJE78522.1 hypothetical protein [Thermococcus sp. GR4]NJF22225.1 hypothetical protein [Thermococcus sp. GR5]